MNKSASRGRRNLAPPADAIDEFGKKLLKRQGTIPKDVDLTPQEATAIGDELPLTPGLNQPCRRIAEQTKPGAILE